MAKAETKRTVGRPAGSTGNELKTRVGIRMYPSQLEALRKKGLKLQVVIDDAVKKALKK